MQRVPYRMRLKTLSCSPVTLVITKVLLQHMTLLVSQQVTAIDYDAKPNISIAFLGSFSYEMGIAKLIIGGIPLAVENVNNNSDLLPNHTLVWSYYDVGAPSSPDAVRVMTKLREEGVAGFIGPDHSCAAEATVASAWNIPMVTYMCQDERISNRTLYPMVVRIQPSSRAIARYIVSFLSEFKWKKVTLIVSDVVSWIHVEESFRNLANEMNITILETLRIPPDYTSAKLPEVKRIIERSIKGTRIYVVTADKYSMIDFVRQAEEYTREGDYVIVTAQDEFYDESIKFQYMRKEPELLELPREKQTPFRAVFALVPQLLTYEIFKSFQERAFARALKVLGLEDKFPGIDLRLPIQSVQAYDAVMVLSKAFTEVLGEGGDLNNGTHVMAKIRNNSFESLLGHTFFIDEDGNTETDYIVLGPYIHDKNTTLRPIGKFNKVSKIPKFYEVAKIQWINGIPKDEPKCGFHRDKCPTEWRFILGGVISAIVIATIGFFLFRKYQYEQKLACLLWKIDMKDVTFLRTNSDYTLQNFRNTINPQSLNQTQFKGLFDVTRSIGSSEMNPFRIGFYKGNVVYIRPVNKRNIDITRSIRKEIMQVREMRHENINPFIGACVDYPNISIMTLYCSRGSLDEILQNEDLDLDNMFVASLVSDLIKGMIYLHDSSIVSHGNLKSSKCLVDNRWVLQITDFGLHEFKSFQEEQYIDEKKKMHGQLWRAPELLRLLQDPQRGTQKGDVYSFGIILYEVIGRVGPWGLKPSPTKCIVDRVMNPHLYDGKIYRPPLNELICADSIKKCMEECWNENPDLRPDFRLINVKLREMQAGLKPNIFDNMIAIMEKYASNLEGLVQERTNQLVEEKKKTENLLLRMLPKPVADQLKRGEPVQAESFDLVTIYFSDIVGFTALSAVSTPLQVVDLLNDLYTCFDSIIENYDVYKVETIGDAYMVVSGLPIRNGNRHSNEIASMALHLLEAIKTFEIRHRPGERLKLRIGIHSGSCVAGVVGLKMPRYCLFGDTVNTASRMESTGEALKIHVSEAFKTILDKQGGYVIKERGITHIKGKGDMTTYWLVGKVADDQSTRPSDQVDSHPPPLRDVINMVDTDFRTYFSRGNELLAEEGKARKISDVSNPGYNSCLNLIHDCRKNVFNELKREGRSRYNGYRSAPIIELRDTSRDFLL